MTKRRTHSSINELPWDLRKIIARMLVDNEWPDDFSGEKKCWPRYKDVVEYCKFKNAVVSKSAVGRYAKRLQAARTVKQANRDAIAANVGTPRLALHVLGSLCRLESRILVWTTALFKFKTKKTQSENDRKLIRRLESQISFNLLYMAKMWEDLRDASKNN